HPSQNVANGAPTPRPQAPPALIKGFKWRDLLHTDEHGIALKYRIVAMRGSEAAPEPLPGVPPLVTNVVTSTPLYGDIEAYFNRGILSTQALTHALSGLGGVNVNVLTDAIRDKTSAVRARLNGQLEGAVLSLLKRRATKGGTSFAALYELTDGHLL